MIHEQIIVSSPSTLEGRRHEMAEIRHHTSGMLCALSLRDDSMFFFFSRKSKHVFYNILIIVLDHIRCVSRVKNGAECVIMCHKSSKV
jgi:hypothetical protein